MAFCISRLDLRNLFAKFGIRSKRHIGALVAEMGVIPVNGKNSAVGRDDFGEAAKTAMRYESLSFVWLGAAC